MTRMFFFLLGFGMSVIGFLYMVLYLNLLTMGYTIIEYIGFILKRSECIFGFIGFLIVTITIFYKGENENVIHI